MIDIKIFRENPDIAIESQRKRGLGSEAVDLIIKLDAEWRDILKKLEALKHKRNVVTLEVSKLKKDGLDATSQIREMQKIKGDIANLESEVAKVKNMLDLEMLKFPNILHESVPVGKDETESVTVREVGKPKDFGFEPKDHIDIAYGLDLVDIERAAKVSGARFYYLKNEAVELEFALIKYVMGILKKEGFTPIIPPVLVREKVLEGAGFLPSGADSIYYLRDDDLCLVGTSEVSLAGYHMNETLETNSLPLYYCGFSSCFRTEAGSHGRDTKGIFRVHQFDKIEMFKFTTPESSWEEHEHMLNTAEQIYQGLELPYRVRNICTGDMGVVAAKKYDIEVWLPGQGAYREVVSCSNCTDYQARRLNIKHRKNPGDKAEFVHTLNSTASAISRTLVAILENGQQEDGSVSIPKVLQDYMGKEKIEVKNNG